MPEFAALVKDITNDALKVAATICEGQAVGLTFMLAQVEEGPKTQIDPQVMKQIQLMAKIEMARELGVQIRSLTK